MEFKANFESLPDDGYTRYQALASGKKGPGVTGVSKSTLVRLIADGLFPQPVRLSKRVTAFRVGDVRAWLQSRKAYQLLGVAI